MTEQQSISPSASGEMTKGGKDLAEVMRQRREGCTEFASVPEASVADVASAEQTSGARAPAAVDVTYSEVSNLIKQAGEEMGSTVSKNGVDLTELMRQRREGCREFESRPEGSGADAGALHGDVSSADQKTETADANLVGKDLLAEVMRQRREGCMEFESKPDGSKADASAGGACDVTTATTSEPKARARKSADDLASLMEQRRNQCQVLENQPTARSEVGAASTSAAPPAPPPRPTRAVPGSLGGGYNAASTAAFAAKGRTSDDDLKGWMEKMKARCQVMESAPEAAVADAVWSEALAGAQDEDASDELFPVQSVSQAIASRELHRGANQTAPAPSAERGAASRVQAAEAAPVQSNQQMALDVGARGAVELTTDTSLQWNESVGLSLSEPLPSVDRNKVWMQVLNPEAALLTAPADEVVQNHVLAKLLHHTSGGEIDKSSVPDMVRAFCQAYLSWEVGDGSRWPAGCLFALVSQVLRYHHPEVAGCFASASTSTAASVLQAVFNERHEEFIDVLLTLNEGGHRDSLLYFCDLVAVEKKPLLLVFIAVVLLAKVSPVDGELFDDLVLRIRKDALASVALLGLDDVRQLVQGAVDLHNSTPLSVGPDSLVETSSVLCVTAEEVVRNVFERPDSSWRLVVIDVRSAAFNAALPVSIRISTSQDRKAESETLPYEECIHLCFMADKTPVLGEEALELAHHITSAPAWRKHVCVIAGGWLAVCDAAQSLGYELTQVEMESDGRLLIRKVGGVRKDVAREVKKAHDVVVKQAQKASVQAQKALFGAGNFFQKLSEKCDNAFDKLGDKLHSTSTSSKASSERDFEFAAGPLGFDVCGARVSRIDDDGPASMQGLRVGDVVIAVSGRRIPAPPPDDTPQVGQQKVKRLITKWIKEHERPVKVTFACAEAPPS